MGRTFSVHINPYRINPSNATSSVIDVRDAFDLSFSWRTTGFSKSTTTLQYSNSRAGPDGITEATWSNWTRFGIVAPTPASASTIKFPALGARWARFISSNATGIVIDVNKLVNG